jgi:hypothetical protein
MRVFLFDIDGVLVKPHGYRKSFFESFSRWLGIIGIKANLPDREVLSLFESYGITNEWDMLAICGSVVLDRYCLKFGITIQSSDIPSLIEEFSFHSFPDLKVDYRESIQKMDTIYQLHDVPPVSVYLNSRADDFPALFQHPILKNILCSARNRNESLSTDIFQHYILGNVLYEKNYQQTPKFNSPSYLKTYDLPLITNDWVEWIKARNHDRELKFVGLTARPSLGPQGVRWKSSIIYSPEAELAMEVLDFPDLLFIAYGKLKYIADCLGMEAELLLKPNPFHAVAAVFTGLTGDEWKGLVQAAVFMHRFSSDFPQLNQSIDPVALPSEMDLLVFEDSQGGIRAVLEAAAIFRKAGIIVHTHCYGITQNDDKRKTLAGLGVPVYATINDALGQVAHQISQKNDDN